MAQETQAQAFALARTLDDSGDIGHHERAVVAVGHNTELRLHGCEGVIGNLRLGRTYSREQCRFTGIGEAYKTYIGEHFKFEHHTALNCRLSGLGIAGGPVGGTLEMPVAKASAASFEELHFLTVVGDFAEIFTCFGVENDSTARNINHYIVAVFTETAAAGTRLTVAGKNMTTVFQRQKSPHITVSTQYNMTAATAVAAVRTAFGHIFGTIKMARTRTAFARPAKYLHIIYKV